jgi:hypothetical protein
MEYCINVFLKGGVLAAYVTKEEAEILLKNYHKYLRCELEQELACISTNSYVFHFGNVTGINIFQSKSLPNSAKMNQEILATQKEFLNIVKKQIGDSDSDAEWRDSLKDDE